jgi:sugar phosphate isomerase/epimerase
VLGACAQAGATLVRAGFYRYDPRTGHRLGVDEARRGLDSLADLAERHSIRLVLQWHHGTLHSSTAHALHLLDGRDSILAYPDPGNQAKEGSESWPLALDMIGVDRVACVGVKNAVWTAPPSATDGGWTCDWRPFADGGVVDWPATLRVLRDRGYRGLLSLHVHYPTGDPLGAVTRDVRHLRELLEGASEM